MRSSDRRLLAGLALFLAGAALIMASVSGGPRWLMWAGLAGIVAAVLVLGLTAWRLTTRPDWDRITAEQRLWESGALGRAWLKLRKTLLGR